MVWAGQTWRRITAGLCIVVGVPAAAERLALDTTEFPRETEAIVAATASLFEAAESRVVPTTPPSALRIAPMPASATGDTTGAFSSEHGPVRHLTGYRITWYPMDTLLGAVDFMGTWDNARNLVCGYVTWDLSDPGAPVLQSLVTNYIDVARIAEADRFEREAALLDANCAFGDIDGNYAALN